jgi:hypothetical protein
MRPGLNLAISTIRAWNDIGARPRIVAPHNSTRTQILFHNPGRVDILVAPVIVVNDSDQAQLQQSAQQAVQDHWAFDWPFEPAQVSPPGQVGMALQPRHPFDQPPRPISNRPLHPSPAWRGGCLQVYGNGGDCVISGNVTMAWQAFALDEGNGCEGGGGLTVVGPNPPFAPMTGQLWWDTNDVDAGGGQLYIWTGFEWTAASCCKTGGGSITPPPPPVPPLPPPRGHPLTVIELT